MISLCGVTHPPPFPSKVDCGEFLYSLLVTVDFSPWKKDRNGERGWVDGFEEFKEQHAHGVLQIKVLVQRVFSSFSVLFMFMSKGVGD